MFSQSETQESVELVLKGQQDFRQTITESIEENEAKIAVASHDFKGLKDQIDNLVNINKEYDKRFSIIFPILRDFKRQPVGTTSVNVDHLQSQLDSMQQKLTKLEQDAWSQIATTPSAPVAPMIPLSSSNVEAVLLDLKHQIKILQHRIVGGGVKIGNKVFQSFEDVQVWVKAELPTRRYGLFVDAVGSAGV